MLIDSCRAIDKITVGFLISNTLYTSSHPSGEVMITGLGTVPVYYNCITPDTKEHVNAVSRCKNLVVVKNVVLLNDHFSFQKQKYDIVELIILEHVIVVEPNLRTSIADSRTLVSTNHSPRRPRVALCHSLTVLRDCTGAVCDGEMKVGLPNTPFKP